MFQCFPVEVINSLSSLELELLRYINSHKEDVVTSSIQDLAKNSFVSTTTVIRLCKKLHLDGYSHLKYFIRQTMRDGCSSASTYASHSLQDLLEEELSDIERTGRGLDLGMVRSVAALMEQQSQIHFFPRASPASYLNILHATCYRCPAMSRFTTTPMWPTSRLTI